MTTTTETTTKTEYYGIADCHGIESFHSQQDPGVIGDWLFHEDTPVTKELLQIRVETNRHRHAVCYTVMLCDKQANYIKDLLADQKCVDALNVLKTYTVPNCLHVDGGSEELRSWELIPNPALDPWR